MCATGAGASATLKDRRVLTVAVVDCTAGNVQGSTNIKVKKWVDMFLVEPSLNRARTGQDQSLELALRTGRIPDFRDVLATVWVRARGACSPTAG